jgi:N-acetylmuramoyl-L-alanine amidase
MVAEHKIFHNPFARLSPLFVAFGVLLMCVSMLPQEARAAANAHVRRQAAGAQYSRGEEQRATLNSKPVEKRTLAEYKQVVSTYRRVYLITPHAIEVPDALLSVAELYTEMGERFGRSYYQLAVESYQFLLREYPNSKYCQDALFRTAKLQKDQLGDSALATQSYQDFLKRFPRSQRRREAQEALADLTLLKSIEGSRTSAAATATQPAPTVVSVEENEPAAAPPAASAERGGELSHSGAVPRIRRISTSATTDATRVVIDLEDTVQYASARISNPDRIFFDLHAAKLTPELARGKIGVEGKLLTAIRVAQNQAGVVRVVLDVTAVKDYTASLLNQPPRLVIDLYPGPHGAANFLRAFGKSKPSASDASSSEDIEQTAASTKASPAQAAAMKEFAALERAVAPLPGEPVNPAGGPNAPASSTGTLVRNAPATSRTLRAKAGRSPSGKPDLITRVAAPQPTRDGQSTLTRTLGLKIGRIVIDAGHGGHDTGTIGPTGLMEKDLCLDVALRLGKIIQQRLPGADIVYTRSDDTFIPLEDRTRIANEAKADLFLSIHANSSEDHAARGIETYYLNLKGSGDSMEVAARENAASQQSIHDLEDLIKKIARTEKIDESREFAEDIQDSLSKRIQKSVKPVKNRGVRKAPFVVLIGADMPSILTEISFLSNPADELLLKKPEYRQRVAEGLYQGVASYLQSLNSMAVNIPTKIPTHRAEAVAQVEQTRNQQ